MHKPNCLTIYDKKWIFLVIIIGIAYLIILLLSNIRFINFIVTIGLSVTILEMNSYSTILKYYKTINISSMLKKYWWFDN